MTLLDEVKRLRELEQRMPPAPFSVKKIRLNEMEGDSWLHDAEGEILELTLDEIADLRNAAPDMLAVLGGFQPGDANKLQQMIEAFSDQLITPAPTIEVLRRLHEMARQMEADR